MEGRGRDNRGAEAQNEAVEAGSVDKWSQICITLMRSRVQSWGIKVKSRIRIRIKVKIRFRIHVKRGIRYQYCILFCFVFCHNF